MYTWWVIFSAELKFNFNRGLGGGVYNYIYIVVKLMLKYDKEKNSKLKVKKGVKVFIMHKTKRDTKFGYVCARRGHN